MGCVSNLKRFGHALKIFFNDDARDTAARAAQQQHTGELRRRPSGGVLYYVYPYLGVRAPSDDPKVVPVAACPGYMLTRRASAR